MANVKISQLPVASTPLAGSEEIPLVQGGITKQVTVNGLLTSANLGTPSVINLTFATNVPVNQATGVLPVVNGGTGAATAAAGIQNLLPSYSGNASRRLGLNSGATALEWVADGGGTVTSVGVSVPAFLSVSNSPITASGTIALSYSGLALPVLNGGTGVTTSTGSGNVVLSTMPTLVTPLLGTPTSGNFSTGTFTWPTFNQNTTGTAAGLSATLAIASGGTGQITANAAFNALVPSQTGNSGKYLTTNGTDTSWGTNPLGTVTSVDVSGGTTGLTTSGGPITSSGTITIAGTLATTNGGTNLTSFTSGGVVFASSSSVLATGSALSFDGTNLTQSANGGLNLTVRNLTSTSDAYIAVQNTAASSFFGINATGPYLYTASNIPFQFITNNIEQMRLNNTGLGIGTNNPAHKLHVSGTGSVASRTFATDATGDASSFVGNNDTKIAGPLVYGSTKTAYGALGSNETAFYSNATTSIMADGASAVIKFAAGGNTEGMRLTSTGLGIGTSSPTAQLQIFGDGTQPTIALTRGTTGTGKGAIAFGIASGNSGSIRVTSTANSTANAVMTFAVADSSGTNQDRMIIDTSGNLGLGVTPSAWNSNFKAIESAGVSGVVLASANVNPVYLGSNWISDSVGNKYKTTGTAALYQVGNGIFAWYNAASGTAGNAITFTQAMTLTAAGSLLLGTTTTPSGGSATQVISASNGGLQLHSTSQTGGALLSSAVASGGLGFYTYTGNVGSETYAERARIDSSGNLLVGTTSSTFLADSGGFIVYLTTTGETNFVVKHDTGTGSGATYASFTYATSSIGNITQAGTTGVLYNVTSDYRLKTVTGAVAGQGARIDALKPVDYQWTESGQQARGFLAHEFQTVYPNSVSGDKDAVDTDGNPKYQAMQASTSEVIADLVAEIQSLRQRLSAANL